MKTTVPLELDPEKLEFHSSCAEGLQNFLEDEILNCKLQILSSNRGGVHFRGKKNSLRKFFLQTRFSSRISFVFHRCKVEDADELYKIAKKLPWEALIPEGKSFKIDSFTKDNLSHSRFALYRLKDAIVDRIYDKTGVEAIVEKDSPDIDILLRSSRENASIQIGLSVHAMNKRGYRLTTLEAPIRENIAQALLAFSGWTPGELLIDPMCGSGTILIEAALLLKNNLNLNFKVLENSYVYTQIFGDKPVEEEPYPKRIKIYGFDINPYAIKIARENAAKAGVEELIRFEEADVRILKKGFVEDKGFFVSNPPYAERMGEKEEIKNLYGQIGRNLKDHFSGYSFTVICGDKSLLGFFKLKSEKEHSITIAKMKGKFVQYLIK